MTASRVRFGALAAGLCCLLAGYVVAQQNVQNRSREAADRPQSSQSDRFETQQTDQFESGQTGTRYRQQNAQARSGQLSPQVEHYLANCLLLHNNAEVEIGQLGQQQAKSPEVKQFAQQMIQDHRKLAQQLQQLAGDQGAADRTGAVQPGASSQFDAQREASDTTQLPGSSGANQAATRTESRATVATQGNYGDNPALNQLAQIDRQITERCTQMTRDELQQKQGAEFDKCFVAAQVGGHMHMLAALETIAQQGQGRLAQIAKQAQPTVQQHLDHAKHLAMQLEQGQGARAGGQAERQQPRTQR